MINQIVSEVRVALSNKLFFSALTLSLILPDTCGKAKYFNEPKNNIRYKNWCKEFVCNSRNFHQINDDMPYLNEDIIYSLRNSLLHQSTPCINKNNIYEEKCKLDNFVLVATDDYIANGDESMVSYNKDMCIIYRELRVYISHLCYILCEAAENYY